MIGLFILILYAAIGIFCFGIFEKFEIERCRKEDYLYDDFNVFIVVVRSIFWPIILFVLLCRLLAKTIYNLFCCKDNL